MYIYIYLEMNFDVVKTNNASLSLSLSLSLLLVCDGKNIVAFNDSVCFLSMGSYKRLIFRHVAQVASVSALSGT